MGVQNATARRLAVPDLTTTVLTLTLTGIAADSRLAGGSGANTARRLLSVAAMLLGATSALCSCSRSPRPRPSPWRPESLPSSASPRIARSRTRLASRPGSIRNEARWPMRAMVYSQTGGSDVLHLVDRPVPVPEPGEVRVRVSVSGVNPTDWKARRGGAPGELPLTRARAEPGRRRYVDAVGEGVDPSRVGERVWLWEAAWQRADGTAQEYVVVARRARPCRWPTACRSTSGASLGIPALTAHSCLTVLGARAAAGSRPELSLVAPCWSPGCGRGRSRRDPARALGGGAGDRDGQRRREGGAGPRGRGRPRRQLPRPQRRR